MERKTSENTNFSVNGIEEKVCHFLVLFKMLEFALLACYMIFCFNTSNDFKH